MGMFSTILAKLGFGDRNKEVTAQSAPPTQAPAAPQDTPASPAAPARDRG